MEAQHRLAELVGLLEDAGVDVLVADPDGSPLERYSVVSVVSGAYGFREEVMWLELEINRGPFRASRNAADHARVPDELRPRHAVPDARCARPRSSATSGY